MTEPISERVEGERDQLPVSALLALAMTGFTAILTETLPAGLLLHISQGLGVSEALAGQTVTAYAAGSLIAAIPLTVWTQGLRRKPTLLAAITGFLIFNTITAISGNYWLTLTVRFLAGVAAGLAWGILAGYARRMVVGPLKGKALAIAMVGTPIALSLGVPAGAFLGATVGWRAAFFAMSGTTIVLIGWVLCAVPNFAGQTAHRRLAIGTVFRMPGIRPILATIFAWMTAHNVLYTYIAPFAVRSGLQARVDLLLLEFGISALSGIALTGFLIDRALRRLVLISLTTFAGVALAFGLFGTVPAVVIAGVALWGMSFGGAATQLQTASADAAGDGVDLANAMITTVWNSAIAVGGIVGGVLLDQSGAGAFSWIVLMLSLIALCIAFGARRNGFTPGPRTHA